MTLTRPAAAHPLKRSWVTCSKPFPSRKGLKAHERTHKPKEHACQCGGTFTRDFDLKRHQKMNLPQCLAGTVATIDPVTSHRPGLRKDVPHTTASNRLAAYYHHYAQLSYDTNTIYRQSSISRNVPRPLYVGLQAPLLAFKAMMRALISSFAQGCSGYLPDSQTDWTLYSAPTDWAGIIDRLRSDAGSKEMLMAIREFLRVFYRHAYFYEVWTGHRQSQGPHFDSLLRFNRELDNWHLDRPFEISTPIAVTADSSTSEVLSSLANFTDVYRSQSVLVKDSEYMRKILNFHTRVCYFIEKWFEHVVDVQTKPQHPVNTVRNRSEFVNLECREWLCARLQHKMRK